eukprot:COSAG05_NODE_4_length_49189_cov_157.128784_13_plen_99_part_00
MESNEGHAAIFVVQVHELPERDRILVLALVVVLDETGQRVRARRTGLEVRDEGAPVACIGVCERLPNQLGVARVTVIIWWVSKFPIYLHTGANIKILF